MTTLQVTKTGIIDRWKDLEACMNLSQSEKNDLFKLQDIHGVFEKIIMRLYQDILEYGDTAIDGGAHLGMHTIPMAHAVGENGHILAFEPLDQIAESLSELVNEYSQVTVYKEALSNKVEMVEFFEVKDFPWLSSLAERNLQGNPSQGIKIVNCITIDSLNLSSLKFIKLDLEHHDFLAVSGGRKTIEKCKPIIVFEFGRIEAALNSHYTEAEFFSLFDGLGYKLIDLFGETIGSQEFNLAWDATSISGYVVATPAVYLEDYIFKTRKLSREFLKDYSEIL